MPRPWVVAVLLLCLIPVTGCNSVSGGGGNGTGDGLNLKAVPQASVSRAVAQEQEADAVALQVRDADGFVVSVPAGRDVVRQRAVQVSDDACAPVAFALAGAAVGKPASTVVRHATGDGADVTVVLAFYDAERAPAAMDALAAALDTCADGFTVTVDGQERRVSDLVPELAPQGADQAMALGGFSVTGDETKVPVEVVVFREGPTVGYLRAVPQGRAAGRDFGVPAAIVQAQLAKFS
ncbi:hypothetical protein OK074_4723 [Actinobacteria bacterium OK074]|nr:hypothetical protein OK074_4723 [Actinobacteria bacterium OK074]